MQSVELLLSIFISVMKEYEAMQSGLLTAS
jgi:hypothetical protein